ncbi:hypothetical protein BGZ68_008444 [Mortierella alpina]|nr:hypothetical protein BGZ68_008444 [Mortierella alpina]
MLKYTLASLLLLATVVSQTQGCNIVFSFDSDGGQKVPTFQCSMQEDAPESCTGVATVFSSMYKCYPPSEPALRHLCESSLKLRSPGLLLDVKAICEELGGKITHI